MRILKVNCYAPDGPLYQAFGPDVTFDIHRAGSVAVAPPSEESCRLADAVINCSAGLHLGVPIEKFPRTRIVVREGVGYDTLDLKGWGARGVPVCNVPDYGTTEVADHALALLLALARGTASYQPALHGPKLWDFGAAPVVRRLRGATIGVVGLGRIGLAAARRAAAFDMRVVFYDPYLPNVLTLHAPLTDETRGMIGAKTLARAKPGLIIVNTARGPIVDLDALQSAMREGRVAAAGLDVLPNEPADLDHPLIAAWRRDEPWIRGRLALTPHAAFYSPSALEDMQRKAIEVIVAYLRDGVLMNCVNSEHLKAH
jgi:lactate dehydrogenase-like 2-hydroxyacid dehydrogenase